MLEYRRYRDAAAHLAELFADGRRYHYRAAPLPPELRRVALDAARPAYEPELLAASIGDLLRDAAEARPLATSARPSRSSGGCGCCASCSQAGGSIDFDESFGDEDKLTQAVTLFALLEMHKRGEATWEQGEVFGPIEVKPPAVLARRAG